MTKSRIGTMAKTGALLALLGIFTAGCPCCKNHGKPPAPAPAPAKQKTLSGPVIKPTALKENPAGETVEPSDNGISPSVEALTAPGATDEVWGGVYAAPGVRVKLLSHNAEAIKLLVEEYNKTGDGKFLDAAKSIHGYIAEFLTAPSGDAFYSSQAGEVKGKSGEEYFKLDRAGREALGIPPRSKKTDVAASAQAVSAYLSLYEALGWETALDTAAKVLENILKGSEAALAGCGGGKSVCADNYYVLEALLDVYQDTGRNVYLDRAVKISSMPAMLDAALKSHGLPIEDMAIFAVSLKRMSYYTGDNEYGKKAEAVMERLQANLSIMDITDELSAVVGKAEAFVKAHPLQMVVLGPESDPATTAMLLAALKFYHPLKVVFALDASEAADKARLAKLPYTPKEKPTLFACVETACAMPVSDPAMVEKRMKAFTDKFLPRDGQKGRLILQNAPRP